MLTEVPFNYPLPRKNKVKGTPMSLSNKHTYHYVVKFKCSSPVYNVFALLGRKATFTHSLKCSLSNNQ